LWLTGRSGSSFSGNNVVDTKVHKVGQEEYGRRKWMKLLSPTSPYHQPSHRHTNAHTNPRYNNHNHHQKSYYYSTYLFERHDEQLRPEPPHQREQQLSAGSIVKRQPIRPRVVVPRASRRPNPQKKFRESIIETPVSPPSDHDYVYVTIQC
jgi:hypothetical protein